MIDKDLMTEGIALVLVAVVGGLGALALMNGAQYVLALKARIIRRVI